MATELPVVGSSYTAVMTFANRSNVAIDPAFINFYYRLPQTNTLVLKTLALNPSSFRHVKLGTYEFDINPLTEYGAYKVRSETDLGVMETEFLVGKSTVL